MSQSITDLLPFFKTQFLDATGTGIRRFSDLTNIRRTRLKKMFDGKVIPTDNEVLSITLAMQVILPDQPQLPSFDMKKLEELEAMVKALPEEAFSNMDLPDVNLEALTYANPDSISLPEKDPLEMIQPDETNSSIKNRLDLYKEESFPIHPPVGHNHPVIIDSLPQTSMGRDLLEVEEILKEEK